MSGHIYTFRAGSTTGYCYQVGHLPDMITNTIFTAVVYCISVSLAAQFPAGIDPRLCPNYPQCDNAILAAFSKNPLPFMTEGRQGGKDALQEFDHFFFTQPGYPVGLSRIQCPNYPFCH